MAAAFRRVSTCLKNARRILEEGGLPFLIFRILQKLCSPVFEFGSVNFFIRDLDGNLPEPSDNHGFHFRQAFPRDLELFQRLNPEKTPETIATRFRRGDLCFVAVEADGRLAHARWLTTERTHIPEIDRFIAMSLGHAYLYDAYTRPDLRRRGIDAAMRGFVFQTLRAGGYRRIYAYTRGDNSIGLRAARRWQKAVGKLWYLRLRGFRSLVIGRRAYASSLPALLKNFPEERERGLDARVGRWRFDTSRVWPCSTKESNRARPLSPPAPVELYGRPRPRQAGNLRSQISDLS